MLKNKDFKNWVLCVVICLFCGLICFAMFSMNKNYTPTDSTVEQPKKDKNEIVNKEDENKSKEDIKNDSQSESNTDNKIENGKTDETKPQSNSGNIQNVVPTPNGDSVDANQFVPDQNVEPNKPEEPTQPSKPNDQGQSDENKPVERPENKPVEKPENKPEGEKPGLVVKPDDSGNVQWTPLD